MKNKKLIVVGGGAAGFFCAINAAINFPELQITLLEKQNKVLQKVKVSGGGRCNVTNSCSNILEFANHYPRGRNFLKKSLHLFSNKNLEQWFNDRGVNLKAEKDGRMFPISNSSETIINCILNEASKFNIEILLKHEVKSVKKIEDKFYLETTKENFEAEYLCIACGGFSKKESFEWIEKLGHTIENPVPSLFTFNIKNEKLNKLMGVSMPEINVKIIHKKLQEKGAALITHWGMSGPCILKLSAWGARELADEKYEFDILINWVNENENQLHEKINLLRKTSSKKTIWNKNPLELPSRLWEFFMNDLQIPKTLFWTELPAKLQNKLITILCSHKFEVRGKTTFKEEFVTCGGVKLTEVNPTTMESRIIKNLFFAGEILDVDGITGGFNFQHAWTSGWIAAKLNQE